MNLPDGAVAADGHPGWYRWDWVKSGEFAAVGVGELIFRAEAEGLGRCRWFPTSVHLNNKGAIHGGAMMSFIDMALFAGGYFAGMEPGYYVTLDCATRFIAPGKIDTPIDAVVKLVGQTRGGLAFLSGECEQDGETVSSFTGTLKRLKPRG